MDWKPLQFPGGGESPSTKRCEYRGWIVTSYTIDDTLANEQLTLAYKDKLTEADRQRLGELHTLMQTITPNATTEYMAHLGGKVLRADTEEGIKQKIDKATE